MVINNKGHLELWSVGQQKSDHCYLWGLDPIANKTDVIRIHGEVVDSGAAVMIVGLFLDREDARL